MSDTTSPVRHVVAWLAPLRWTTCLLLGAALIVVWVFPQLDPPLRAIALLGLPAAICRNLLLLQTTGDAEASADPSYVGRVRIVHPARATLTGMTLIADAVLLTGLLDITGGPFNPFIVMYGVYVWTAVATASLGWAASVALASVIGFGWLVGDHVRADLTEHHQLTDFPTHLFTMWFAGAGIAELIAHYMAQARATLAQRQQQLDDARDRMARSERLASLTTLAAGAAHELSTPLATIAVAARELERNAVRVVEPHATAAVLRDDAALIRSELDRCQTILDGMSGRAGAGVPPSLEPMSPYAIAEVVKIRLANDRRCRLAIDIAPDTPAPSATGAEVVQAIASLLSNAFDAGDDTGVTLRMAPEGSMVRIEVRDIGTGLTPDAVRRVGEPFYTTKGPGKGLGLGLFLVRTFAERSGGTLDFTGGEGTTAILQLPAVTGGAAVLS